MGPGLKISLATQPRFAWHVKSPQWTYGKGNLKRYTVVMDDYKELHNSLNQTDSNKKAPSMQGLILKSQLYGQADNLCA